MKNKLCILGVLIFCSLSVSSQNQQFPARQILQLRGVFVNEQPVTIDFKATSTLNDILSNEFTIPYTLYKNRIKGVGKYELTSESPAHPKVVTSLSPAIDSICMQRIRNQVFLRSLPFSYRAVKQLTFLIHVDLDNISPKRITDLPLESFGEFSLSLDTARFSALLSEKKEFLKNKKSGKGDVYEVLNGGESYFISSGDRYEVKGKNKFTVDGTIWSIIQVSNESTLILARKGACCDPVILTEYVLSGGGLTVKSKTELYGLTKYFSEHEKFRVQAVKKAGRYHYLKTAETPLSFKPGPACPCSDATTAESILGIQPIGNDACLLKDNSIIYRLVNTRLETGFYGLVEARKNDVGYKTFVGGWIE